MYNKLGGFIIRMEVYYSLNQYVLTVTYFRLNLLFAISENWTFKFRAFIQMLNFNIFPHN